MVITIAWPDPSHAQRSGDRRMLPSAWEARDIVDGHVNSELLRPALLTSHAGKAIIFDYGDLAVKAFSIKTGQLVWQFGRRGRGPGEFSNPTDMRMDDRGILWILDRENNRITLLRSDGTLEREIRTNEMFMRMILLPDRGFIGVRSTQLAPYLVRHDSLGTRLNALQVPAWLAAMQPMTNDSRVAETGDGFVIGLWNTGALLAYDWPALQPRDLSAIEINSAPEEVILRPAPNHIVRRLPPDAVTTIQAMSYANGRLYVHVAGASRHAKRLVDVYDMPTGRYVGSHLLPSPAKSAVIAEEGIIVLEAEFLPRLYLLIPE